MKIPLSLIRSFVRLEMPAAQIAETLTLLGIEVDRVENDQPSFARVVVGEVLSTKKHPNSDRLQVAQVSDGEGTYSVICGAPNCRTGMKTAFARVGALLTDADGLQRQIEKSTIRGVESHGMLCSGSELRVSENREEILDLPPSVKTGEDVAHLLWDPVFELSLTPNLGHCMSALGIARELSAALQIPLSLPKEAALSGAKIPVVIHDSALCPRYTCCLIEQVQIEPSSFWIKRQLEASLQKSINSVVDAGNYVMMKMGQPLHAFDFDLLEGETIQVGPAKSAFKFLGLDGVERDVPAGTLLIFDEKKPIAIAGVIGGANSAVSEKTKRVLLEAAYFDPISIRNTAKKLGLRTESSQRFERGIDPSGQKTALLEAAQLMGGKIKAFADAQKGPLQAKEIEYRPSKINQILGTKLSETEMEEIFGRLGIVAKGGKARIPFHRSDLTEEIDLVEEIARIYGYNHIEKTIPKYSTSLIPNDPIFLFEREMRGSLLAAGLTEFINCDLIGPKWIEIIREITPPTMGFLQTTYSKSEEFSFLRASLLPGLLQVVKGNVAQKNHSISAFELGRIHFLQNGKVIEIPMAAILLTGKREPPHWSSKQTDFDFFDLKGVIESLVSAQYIASSHLSLHPGRQADIQVGDLIVGSLGEVHPTLLEKFDLDQRVLYAELNLIHLLKQKPTHLKIRPLPQFPSSERDWTLSLEIKTPIRRIFELILSQNSPLLEKVELIDLYLPEGAAKKNATFRFVYRDPFKTVSFEEVEKEHSEIIHAVLRNSL